MNTIDLKRIRGQDESGRRNAFEELVCQIARREPPEEGAVFRRVEGSGGDGGVEAYWLHEDGSKTAYQAKYWARTADINWDQIDKSVKQALGTHPEIENYIVALACNLTDRSGKKGKGKKGWEHWQTHSDKWQRLKEEGGSICFQAWTASDIREKSLALLSAGAIRYWFDETLLTDEWFKNRSEISISDLGLRYSPSTNVDTEVNKHFQSLCQNPACFDEFAQCVDTFRSCWKTFERWLARRTPASLLESHSPLARIEERLSEIKRLKSSCVEFGETADFCWAAERQRWEEILFSVSDFLSDLPEPILKDAQGSRSPKRVDEVEEALYQVWETLDAKQLELWDERVLLVAGTFGTGKSHALGRLLESSIAESRPVVMFLGQRFNDASPRDQMIQMLGLEGELNWNNFLDVMNTAAEARRKLGVILVDAINEGQGRTIWPTNMAGIVTEMRTRSALRLVVSCRSEYKEGCWPTSLDAPEYAITDFTEEEFQHASVRLMDEQGISRPNVAFLPRQFYNPLILNTACQSLKAQGLTQFPGSLLGIQDFVSLYLDGVESSVKQKVQSTRNLKPGIERAFYALAQTIVRHRQRFVEENDARIILRENIHIPAPVGQEWLDVLLQTGTLRLDPHPHAQPVGQQSDVVRFSFQLHEEYFIAQVLISAFSPSSLPPSADNGAQALRTAIESGPEAIQEWRGVLIMLSVLCPQMMGSEIIDLLPSSEEAPTLYSAAAGCLLQGLLWRRPEDVGDRTTELIGKLFDHSTVYSTILNFASTEGHAWNALFLDRQMRRYHDMAGRDAEWTLCLNHEPQLQAVVDRHIEWSLSQSAGIDLKVAELAAIALTWFLTASNRPMRDRATKALVNIIRLQPRLAPKLLARFQDTNDPYGLERLLAAIYGACCTLEGADVRIAAQAIYDVIFSNGSVPLHLLARDYALGTIERAKYLGVLPEQVEVSRCFPPHLSPWPIQRFTNEEIDELARSVGDIHGVIARSCTTEYGRGTCAYGDFGRYELESRVREFSVQPLDADPPLDDSVRNNWDGELIGNWVAQRAYQLGWTAELFPHDRSGGLLDHSMHRPKVERIGKKYQWIAMFELLGILSDNVWCGGCGVTPKRYQSALDIPFCRDVDPTVLSEKCVSNQAMDSIAEMRFRGVGSAENQSSWPFVEEQLVDFEEATTCIYEDGRRWYRLFGFANDDMHTEGDFPSYYSFVRLSTICVPKGELDSVLGSYREKRLADPSGTAPVGLVDNEYLFEVGWRFLQDGASCSNYLCELEPNGQPPNGSDHLATVHEYRWDSGDESMPNGLSTYLPYSWIATKLGLAIDPGSASSFRDRSGIVRFFSQVSSSGGKSNTACLIDAQMFDQLLEEEGLACIWILGGERHHSVGFAAGQVRSFSGLAWLESGVLKPETWFHDRGQGAL